MIQRAAERALEPDSNAVNRGRQPAPQLGVVMHCGRKHRTDWLKMRVSDMRLRLPGLLCLMALMILATLLAYSCGGHDGAPGEIRLPPELSAKFGSLTEDSIAPFEAADIEPIKVNYLHQQHNSAGLECAACHTDKQPLGVKAQLALCVDCHNDKDEPDFFISRELWTSHCFVCHQFQGDRINEKSFSIFRRL